MTEVQVTDQEAREDRSECVCPNSRESEQLTLARGPEESGEESAAQFVAHKSWKPQMFVLLYL